MFFITYNISTEMILILFLFLKRMLLIFDDAFFQPEPSWSVLWVVGPDLDCWRAGLQALGSFGLR